MRIKQPARARDPVHQHKGAWWFWDEIWVHRMGPYDSEDEVRLALRNYCLQELGLTKEELGIQDKELT